MNALDFSPLCRTAIGFDRLARMLETARTAPDAQSYPPWLRRAAGGSRRCAAKRISPPRGGRARARR